MPRNFVIGIGGTGARCVEALMHLCAAGLGPPDLWVGFIDQDSSNGNLSDAMSVLRNQAFLRQSLREEATDQIGDDQRFAFTELWAGAGKASANPPDAGIRWRPAPNDDDTLERLFAYNGADTAAQFLMQALYYRGPPSLDPALSEHRMPLKSGFRGRPGLGAAVLLGKANDRDDSFWKGFVASVKTAAATGSEEPARVLLVGSVFGGTGAGGLPIIARYLRSLANDPDNRWKMNLSAILVGPYFRFVPPDTQMVLGADPDNFPAKLRDSFQYYANLLEGDPTFDRVYLAGWANELDYKGDAATDRTGGPEQRNPATLPELYAALAATDYFAATDLPTQAPGEPAPATTIYATGWRGADMTIDSQRGTRQRYLTWSDLPAGSGRSTAELRRSLGRLIRFCHVYRSFFHRYLAEDIQNQRIRREHWYRALARSGMEDPLGRDPKPILEKLNQYCGQLLTWWGGIDLVRANADLPRALVDSSVFAALGAGSHTHINLKSNVVDSDSIQRFATMVAGEEGRRLALDTVFRTLTNAPPNAKAQGLGRFLRALSDACDA